MERADFYVLAGNDSRARWKFACQEIERAFLAEQRVLVCFDADDDLARFDELLWTFADRSFVPHEPVTAESDWEETPVLLSAGTAPPSPAQLIVNLSAALPAGVADAKRVIEIVDEDPARRQSGRERFRQYRAMGIEPTTHKPGAASA
ncbi:MAG: DNA polymerase III subunit chi [Gammaproteobacteria bacterium]|nr:DNA polymerase III subunit chi [Gammaproteobacteria bacterium]MDE2251883.1 DNA polymerase III subunit chi [Gammaproteobacteria bacterium]